VRPGPAGGHATGALAGKPALMLSFGLYTTATFGLLGYAVLTAGRSAGQVLERE
jgi:hypothetical protein